jgi:hypothetical protein
MTVGQVVYLGGRTSRYRSFAAGATPVSVKRRGRGPPSLKSRLSLKNIIKIGEKLQKKSPIFHLTFVINEL